MAAAMDGLEKTTTIIHRYVAVEKVYWSGEYDAHDAEHFEDAIIKLYCQILEYEAKSAHYFRINTPGRTLRNILKIDNWAELITKIQERASECDQFSHTIFAKNILTTLNNQREYIYMMEAFKEQRRIKEENREIIKWVSNVPVFDDHEYVRTEKLGRDHWNSGTWLLNDSSQFKKWKSSQQGNIWLKGTVGTGKSCLTSIVINDLLETFTDERLAFFYCSSDKDYSTPIKVLQSLAAQLSRSANWESISPAIKAYYEKKKNQHPNGSCTLNVNQCEDYLVELITLNKCTTIVVDALDECSPSPITLLQCLEKVSKRSQHVKLFLSSRDDVLVTEYISEIVEIRVSSSVNFQDITLFIKGVLANPDRRNSKVITSELADRLQKVLIDRSEGM